MSSKTVDRKLERAALKTITSGLPSAMRLLAKIDESYFDNQFNKAAFRRIKTILKKRSEIPSWRDLTHDPALSESAKVALQSYKIKQTVNRKNCDSLYELLGELRRRRMLDQLSKEINEALLNSETPDTEKLLQQATNKLTQIRSLKEISHPLVMGKNDNSSKLITKILKGKAIPVIPTGFKNWDETNGGFPIGSLVILGGYTGHGKSTIASKLADNFADFGVKVGEYSLEMSKEENLIRRLARYSKIDVTKIINAQQKPLTAKEERKIREAHAAKLQEWKERGSSIETHVPTAGVDIDELFLSVAPYGYNVLFIDYVSLLEGVNGDDFWRRLGDVAFAGKNFAKHNKCIVVLIVQSDEKDVVKFSKSMAHHADLVWIIRYDAEKETNEIMVINTPKARKQKAFPIALKKEFQYSDVTDAPHDALERMSKKKVSNKRSGEDKYDEDEVEVRKIKRNKKQEDEELESYFSQVDID